MSTSTQNTETKAHSAQGFGEKLRQARASRGYSLDQVAQELNILKRHVQAIEEENFSALPPFAYARGFVANYAKLLDLDSEACVIAFDNAYPSSLRPTTVHSPLVPMGEVNRGRSRMSINPWLVAGFIGLVIFGFILLKIISNATNKPEEPHLDTQTVTLTPSEQAQGASVDVAAAVQVGGEAIAGMGVVDIWSKGDVAIKISDKNGHILMQGLQSRGGYQLKGETPLTVEIDNPAQVDINFNQKPIRLGEYTKDGKAVFTLP